MKKLTLLFCFLSLVLIFLVPFSVNALPITFTHSGRGTGHLDDMYFTDAAFTITAFGDTDARVVLLNYTSTCDVYLIEHTSAYITIDNLGTVSFITKTLTFANDSGIIGMVGFSFAEGEIRDLFSGPIDTGFGTWEMLSSIGPISGTGHLEQWESVVSTTSGILYFNQKYGVPATFQAVLGSNPVPLPATIWLLGSGLIGLIGVRRFRGNPTL